MAERAESDLGTLRASLAALVTALSTVVVVSLLVAVGVPRAVPWRLVLLLAAWAKLALLLVWMFLPGFELPFAPAARRIVRRAVGSGAAEQGASERVVALTFDDGPHPDTTPGLLDALARAGVHATFFLVGQNVRRWPELARRIAAAGHAVGNHTERHRLLTFRTVAQVEDEIRSCQEALAALGLTPTLFRPPHGFKPVGLLSLLARHGLRMAAWQGSIRDTDAPGAEAIATRALRLAAPGRILLLHDNPSTQGQSAQALPALIAGYRRLGYRFITLG